MLKQGPMASLEKRRNLVEKASFRVLEKNLKKFFANIKLQNSY